jgi:hypothetical protein
MWYNLCIRSQVQGERMNEHNSSVGRHPAMSAPGRLAVAAAAVAGRWAPRSSEKAVLVGSRQPPRLHLVSSRHVRIRVQKNMVEV